MAPYGVTKAIMYRVSYQIFTIALEMQQDDES